MRSYWFLSLLTALSIQAVAQTNCPSHYWAGHEPTFTNQKLAKKAREVCFTAFGVMHSGVTKTPLWSAEHLTRDGLENAKGLQRVNNFHSEDALPVDERSELSDYVRSGFDRGHMAPSADMPTEDAQYESFSLANMIPQNPDNNRHLWEGIESTIRYLTKKRGELYVITGTVFQGNQLQRLNGRVMVPTHIYKAVYDPNSNEAAAYLVQNEATKDYTVVSIEELETLTGISFFPQLSAQNRVTKFELPKPRSYSDRKKKGEGY